jgi:hypothetical protein
LFCYLHPASCSGVGMSLSPPSVVQPAGFFCSKAGQHLEKPASTGKNRRASRCVEPSHGQGLVQISLAANHLNRVPVEGIHEIDELSLEINLCSKQLQIQDSVNHTHLAIIDNSASVAVGVCQLQRRREQLEREVVMMWHGYELFRLTDSECVKVLHPFKAHGSLGNEKTAGPLLYDGNEISKEFTDSCRESSPASVPTR